MKATVIEGTITFSLIVLNESRLGSIESAIESAAPEEVFDFLPQGTIVNRFEVIQEVKEVTINVSQATGELSEN